MTTALMMVSGSIKEPLYVKDQSQSGTAGSPVPQMMSPDGECQHNRSRHTMTVATQAPVTRLRNLLANSGASPSTPKATT